MDDNIEQFFHHRLHIKQEIVPVEDSPVPSSSVSQNEDSSLPSTSSIKIKQEPGSKLSSLKKSLELNVNIRALLEDEIKKLKASYANNLEKQAILKKVLDEDRVQKANEKPPSQIRAISVFAAPYIRDVKRMVPPENEDTVIKRKNYDINAYMRPPRPWTQAENKKLLDGVTAYALFSALLPLKRLRNNLKGKLKDKNISDSEIEEVKEQLILIEGEMQNVNQKPLHELLHRLEGKIDWLTVSATNLQGVRTPEECEIMWNNYLDFEINKEAFDETEDKKLLDLAEDYKERNWDVIAATLQTNRTAIQCFERYQTRLSTNLRKKYWTKEEDELLIALVDEHKCGEIIPWNKISLLMEGRTRQQIINRYDRSVSQKFNRGPWTPEEDAILLACHFKFGFHWAKMKDFFKRRSTYSIRERYVNALDPTIKTGPWSKDEDRLLISMIRRYGYGKWSRICKKIPGRTDNMCLIRAGRLLEYSVKHHSDHGTGEYDPGIYDPEMFSKILKPCAPSKLCTIRNARLRSYRVNGIKMLLRVLETIVPDFKAEVENLNSVDFSWMSTETLHQVSEKLHKMLEERGQGKPEFVPQFRYFKKPPLLRKRDSEVSDDDQYLVSPEKKIPIAEKEWTDSVLAALFKMSGQILQPSIRKSLVYNAREYAEISLYKAYLFKQFHCSAVCDPEDDLENVKFAGFDYTETLQTVASFFIQPPIYENQFIALAPNLSTMTGMEVTETTENRLLSMSECLSHSKNYVDYICERRKSSPECLQCLHRRNDGKLVSSKATPESVISDMKRKFFEVDETMEHSAYVEGASAEKCCEICSCASLAASQKPVQLLRKRFMALFLWPAFLASTDFNKEQDHILVTERANDNEKNYFWHMNVTPMPPPRTTENRRKRRRIVPKSEIPESSEPEVPKVKRPRKVIIPEVLRRSKRTCVLNRTSFSYPENSNSGLSLPKKSVHALCLSGMSNINTLSLPEVTSSS